MAYRDTAQKLASHACGMAYSNWPQTLEDSLADALRKNVVIEIAAERQRQIDAEGWTPEHDDMHCMGDLATAASLYAEFAATNGAHEQAMRFHNHGKAPADWPWDNASFKPKDRRRDLIRAAALIVAEIERLDRAAMSDKREPKS